MKVNTRKIIGRIAELGLTGEAVSNAIGVNPATYYRKMASGGGKFTVEQVQRLLEVLQITKDEAVSIFFAE